MRLRLLQLLEQLSLKRFQLLGLLLELRDVFGKLGTLLGDVLPSLLVFVIQKFLTLLISELFIELDLPLAIVSSQFPFALGLLQSMLLALFRRTHRRHHVNFGLVVHLMPNFKIVSLFLPLLHYRPVLELLCELRLLEIIGSAFVVVVVLFDARANLLCAFSRVDYFFAGARLFFLEHAHSVLELKHILLQFNSDRAGLAIG